LSNRAPSAEYFKKVTLATNYCDKYCSADCVPDPYYGGEEGFEYVIDLLEDACAGLIDSIIKGDF
jgi:protein-tyrosine phosphatase